MENKEETLSFEEAMNKLESVVEKLEEGDVPLEKAIAMFQEGMELSKQCHNKLQAVEKQMDEIVKDDGEVELTNLQEESSE
ncbi:exodeoxyribonuclease VII small subunit [Texcoconibacillus texcoconensis]|uniref:Exodeoxyribonuclease 7 small subunit n=1 Tax=Texcoconibacillus texcoconensis TaxID=1095777 RepID=A0A840QP09_9BACI|nr:exodeoxyribonuclease VII small subunit [Texcoconibacillus texcoconensis]MBB5173067.1 exodeoxyribonuclease VII small subunit [Texcoconibacillus texcoconensis]